MIQIGINLQTNDLNQCCRIRIIGIFTVWIRKLLTKRNVLTFLIALFKGSQIANRIKMTCSGKKFQPDFLSLCHKLWYYFYIWNIGFLILQRITLLVCLNHTYAGSWGMNTWYKLSLTKILQNCRNLMTAKFSRCMILAAGTWRLLYIKVSPISISCKTCWLYCHLYIIASA